MDCFNKTLRLYINAYVRADCKNTMAAAGTSTKKQPKYDPSQSRLDITTGKTVLIREPVEYLDRFTIGHKPAEWAGFSFKGEELTPAETLLCVASDADMACETETATTFYAHDPQTGITMRSFFGVPVLGLMKNCYMCKWAPMHNRIWSLCNACKRELTAAWLGKDRREWPTYDGPLHECLGTQSDSVSKPVLGVTIDALPDVWGGAEAVLIEINCT